MKKGKYLKSKYQIQREEHEKDETVKLYQMGYSTRKTSLLLKEMGIKRSHTWVAEVVKERLPDLSTA